MDINQTTHLLSNLSIFVILATKFIFVSAEIDRFISCQILIFLGKKDKKKKKKNKKEDDEDDLDKALADLKIEVNVDDDAAAKKKAKKVKK